MLWEEKNKAVKVFWRLFVGGEGKVTIYFKWSVIRVDFMEKMILEYT